MRPDFYKEETICGYTVSAKMKKIWAVQLDLLQTLEDVCNRNGLRFYIMYGTLLGAVRHQGFIPWDDDIDVVMLRRDYDELKKIAKKEFQSPFFLQTPENDPSCFYGGYLRLRNSNTTGMDFNLLEMKCNQGIWLDILPLEESDGNPKKYIKKWKKVLLLQRLLYAKVYGKGWEGRKSIGSLQWLFYRFMAAAFDHGTLCRKLEQCCRKQETGSNQYLVALERYQAKCNPVFFRIRDFDEQVLLDFEGKKLPAPVGYRHCLSLIHGETYMNFPPEQVRKPHHMGFFEPDVPFEIFRSRLLDTYKETQGKTIVLFGAGLMFEDYLEKKGQRYKPAFLVDNDARKWGTFRKGYEIKNPQVLREIPENQLHLIICNIYYKQIQKQLEEMGIRKYYIYIQEKKWLLEGEKKVKEYKVGYIAGVFDLFHVGHLNLLRNASEHCDYLIVGVLTDELVERFKKQPPYIPFEERLEIIEACKYVNRAVPVEPENLDKMEAWKLYHYDCLFSGDDWSEEPSWIADRKRLQAVGSDIQFFPYTKSTSSTMIKAAISTSVDQKK